LVQVAVGEAILPLGRLGSNRQEMQAIQDVGMEAQ
jgi:hypothetical protein